MPGIINMENGTENGVRTDHDRDPGTNGINGAGGENHQATDKLKNMADSGKNSEMINGDYDGSVVGIKPEHDESSVNGAQMAKAEKRSRMNDLPDEIIHITERFVPLSLLLTRLAQVSHNALQQKVLELARMPIPAAAVNGNTPHSSISTDDPSPENVHKKASLLHFAQDMHAKWVKALVITEWSRKAEMVSKLIDLKFHIDQQQVGYDAVLDDMIGIKRGLTYARQPNPDLKTALQVLSTGEAPWVPEVKCRMNCKTGWC
jgi:hypothetical protein